MCVHVDPTLGLKSRHHDPIYTHTIQHTIHTQAAKEKEEAKPAQGHGPGPAPEEKGKDEKAGVCVCRLCGGVVGWNGTGGMCAPAPYIPDDHHARVCTCKTKQAAGGGGEKAGGGGAPSSSATAIEAAGAMYIRVRGSAVDWLIGWLVGWLMIGRG